MQTTLKHKDFYSETEAAQAIGISIARLHLLLDENIFNDGSRRPAKLTLRASDVVLLRFWHLSTPDLRIVRTPPRS